MSFVSSSDDDNNNNSEPQIGMFDDEPFSYTYASGFSFSSRSTIGTKTIVRLCDAMRLTFGSGYEFAPEPITEGGILFCTWPNRRPGEFKTVRLNVLDGAGAWPWIDGAHPLETLRKWRESSCDSAIWSVPDSRSTRSASPFFADSDKVPMIEGTVFYKAFYGAPCWTVRELRALADAFDSVGMYVKRKTLLPRRTVVSLVSYGVDCGKPRPEREPQSIAVPSQ